MMLLTYFTLQDLEATEHGFTSEPTEEGLATLAAVQAAVFGPAAASRPFTECVFLATLSQVGGWGAGRPGLSACWNVGLYAAALGRVKQQRQAAAV